MLKKYHLSKLTVWMAFLSCLFLLAVYTFSHIVLPRSSSGCRPAVFSVGPNPTQTTAIWQGRPLSPLLALSANLSLEKQKILGIQSQDKLIEIDLSEKTLTASQNGQTLISSQINIGKFSQTPVGEFQIFQKFPSVTLSGGSFLSKSNYYLPNVPYSLYFTPDFAIHGSYWSENFGTQSGFGCIELPIDQAELLYYWTDSPNSSSTPGTKVIIRP